MRLNLQCIIWWKHFTWREGWTLLSTAKFVWSVKTRSIHDDELGSKWGGSEIAFRKPCIVFRDSICMPSWNETYSGYHNLDIALKSPSMILKKVWTVSYDPEVYWRQKFFKLSNRLTWWLIHEKNIPVWLWSIISQTMHCAIKQSSIISKVNLFWYRQTPLLFRSSGSLAGIGQ